MIQKWGKILSGKDIIIDGNFYHKKQIEDLKNKLSKDIKVFTLKANLNDCIKRDKKRKNSIGEIETRKVYKLVNSFDFGTNIHTENKSPEEIANIIYKKLK